jgi:hypothetical protein
MKRVASTGACLGILAAVGACGGASTVSDSGPGQTEGNVQTLDGNDSDVLRNLTFDHTGLLPDGGDRCVEAYAPMPSRGARSHSTEWSLKSVLPSPIGVARPIWTTRSHLRGSGVVLRWPSRHRHSRHATPRLRRSF